MLRTPATSCCPLFSTHLVSRSLAPSALTALPLLPDPGAGLR
jgi:hypothetical protein